MRLGCCAGLEQIEAARDAGFDYVEVHVRNVKAESPESEFDPIREQILSAEITPEVWLGLIPPDMKVVGPEVDGYRIERYIRTALERIEELGGEVVVFGSGAGRRIPDGFSADEARDQLVEFLTLAGQVAGAYGITVAVEPLNYRETNTINTIMDGLDIVRAVDHPFVKLLVDLYHVEAQGESVANVAIAQGEIVHAHTADTDRLYPGSGIYPNREFIAALKAADYDERLSVECRWQDFYSECGKALQYLRGLA